jgi:hypothetical protein
MGYCLSLVKFSAAGRDPIPFDGIVGTLIRHGCKVPALQEGRNDVVLPRANDYRSAIGDSATLTVKGSSIFEFDIDRPQCTAECKALLYSLIYELELVMFPDFGRLLYAREDVFRNVPRAIVDQFSEFISVTQPDDCFP